MSGSNTPGTRALNYGPVMISVLAMAIYFFILERGIFRVTGGIFIYPMDDPYIHMQIAKNLAFFGSWGINTGEFGSASSSILYPMLLAVCFRILGSHAVIPFLINCVAGVILLFVLNQWLVQQRVKVAGRSLMLLAMVFLTPLPIMILIGMEHTLQCIFCFLFIKTFSGYLADLRSPLPAGRPRVQWELILYGTLVTMIRYEGLFLVAIACVLLLYYRKISFAFRLGAVSCIPVIAFGVYSVSRGSYFLPNSLLIKSELILLSPSGIIHFIRNVLVYKLSIYPPEIASQEGDRISLTATLRLLILLPLVYLLFSDRIRQKSSYIYFLLILTLVTLLHLSLASTGWYFRYEAYLVVCAAAIVMVIFYQYGQAFLKGKKGLSLLMTVALAAFLFFPFLLRSVSAFSIARRSCVNIFEQQYQSARFIKKYYSNDAIAANDIGALSYYNNVRTIDLFGLAAIDVLRSKMGKYYSPDFLDSLVKQRHVKLAIVYDDWFDKTLLSQWVKVGSWEISNNVICANPVVSVYVMNGEDKTVASAHLRDFEKSLPAGVKTAYY
jgi:hypothetical protein